MTKTAQPDTRRRGKKPYSAHSTLSVIPTAKISFSAEGQAPWSMSPEQLRQAIDLLFGGNQSQFARICGVAPRTVNRWTSDHEPCAIPKVVQVLIRAWSLLSSADREQLFHEAADY
ncbi:MAG: hypothetical protein V2J55_10930 [Candidatus Competibacteraceae bacterium]|jgi:hypothetical protein|nr:hypothetical protein [Candidatus Competibacteraceae bacterium]